MNDVISNNFAGHPLLYTAGRLLNVFFFSRDVQGFNCAAAKDCATKKNFSSAVIFFPAAGAVELRTPCNKKFVKGKRTDVQH